MIFARLPYIFLLGMLLLTDIKPRKYHLSSPSPVISLMSMAKIYTFQLLICKWCSCFIRRAILLQFSDYLTPRLRKRLGDKINGIYKDNLKWTLARGERSLCREFEPKPPNPLFTSMTGTLFAGAHLNIGYTTTRGLQFSYNGAQAELLDY